MTIGLSERIDVVGPKTLYDVLVIMSTGLIRYPN